MSEGKLSVTLLSSTPNAEETVALAGRLCYSAVGAKELNKEMKREEKKRLLELLIKGGHHSPLEHASFTFGIEGISRACSHQLVRHRIASYSQQSQRYVKENDFDFIVPPQIKKDKELEEKFLETMSSLSEVYKFFVKKLLGRGRSKEESQEDSRFILPNACETKIVMSMNARELMHISNLRLCTRAQWEIRQLFRAIREEVKKVAPIIASYMAPKCDEKVLGYCPEGKMGLACPRVKSGKIKLKRALK